MFVKINFKLIDWLFICFNKWVNLFCLLVLMIVLNLLMMIIGFFECCFVICFNNLVVLLIDLIFEVKFKVFCFCFLFYFSLWNLRINDWEDFIDLVLECFKVWFVILVIIVLKVLVGEFEIKIGLEFVFWYWYVVVWLREFFFILWFLKMKMCLLGVYKFCWMLFSFLFCFFKCLMLWIGLDVDNMLFSFVLNLFFV